MVDLKSTELSYRYCQKDKKLQLEFKVFNKYSSILVFKYLSINMKNTKMKVYKKVLKEICERLH